MVILLCLALCAQAQFKKEIPSYALTFIGGFADGGAEALKWHYDKVDARLNLNDQYWNPQISYRNKYATGTNIPKFPGSTTYLVWTTDGYHMLRMVRNVSLTGAIVFHPHKKKKWYKYAIDFVGHMVVYQAGFYLSYEL